MRLRRYGVVPYVAGHDQYTFQPLPSRFFTMRGAWQEAQAMNDLVSTYEDYRIRYKAVRI